MSRSPRQAVDHCVRAQASLAGKLFDEIGARTRVDGAILRAPYGPGEQLALDLVAQAARDLGLAITQDWAGNLYMTWRAPGAASQSCIVGSHLDSVPRGGNFDGLAGILAGLVAIAAMKESGAVPACGITVMGIRAEESAWFGAQHIGSRMALGLFDPALLDSARRIDTRRTLAEHMAEAGLDCAPVRARRAYLDPGAIRCFLELHIEQGPILDDRGIATGVVSAIRGNVRCANSQCVGAYEHSGTVPRALRKDAVMAVSELVTAMDEYWQKCEREGTDLVLTFGQMSTDPAAHSVTTIPGTVNFSFDARSHSDAVLQGVQRRLQVEASAIARARGVEFRFGPFTGAPAIVLDRPLHDGLLQAAERMAIPSMSIASGAGHDAGDFAGAGVPTGMVFVRNANGSHNPAEAMQMHDFTEATRLLCAVLVQESAARTTM